MPLRASRALFPFLTRPHQHPSPSALSPFRHQGNKTTGRKWRDELRKQHLLPISYRGGGIASGRGKTERAVGKEQEGKRSDREESKWEDNSKRGENSWGRAMRGRTCRERKCGREGDSWRERGREGSTGRATERDWLVLYEIRRVHLQLSVASSSVHMQTCIVYSTYCALSTHTWIETPTCT